MGRSSRSPAPAPVGCSPQEVLHQGSAHRGEKTRRGKNKPCKSSEQHFPSASGRRAGHGMILFTVLVIRLKCWRAWKNNLVLF